MLNACLKTFYLKRVYELQRLPLTLTITISSTITNAQPNPTSKPNLKDAIIFTLTSGLRLLAWHWNCCDIRFCSWLILDLGLLWERCAGRVTGNQSWCVCACVPLSQDVPHLLSRALFTLGLRGPLNRPFILSFQSFQSIKHTALPVYGSEACWPSRVWAD